MGRKSTYTPEIAIKICERLSAGESLNAICKGDEYPSEFAVRRWAIDDVQGFASKYARAREIQAEKLADEIIEISDAQKEVDKEGGGKFDPDTQRDRLRVDARKWYLSKVLPKKYGDRTQSDVNLIGTLNVVKKAESMSDDELAAIAATKAN